MLISCLGLVVAEGKNLKNAPIVIFVFIWDKTRAKYFFETRVPLALEDELDGVFLIPLNERLGAQIIGKTDSGEGPICIPAIVTLHAIERPEDDHLNDRKNGDYAEYLNKASVQD